MRLWVGGGGVRVAKASSSFVLMLRTEVLNIVRKTRKARKRKGMRAWMGMQMGPMQMEVMVDVLLAACVFVCCFVWHDCK